MAKTFQATQEDTGYALVEVLPSGTAGFADVKYFANNIKVLEFLDMGDPSPELRAAWEARLDKGTGFTVEHLRSTRDAEFVGSDGLTSR